MHESMFLIRNWPNNKKYLTITHQIDVKTSCNVEKEREIIITRNAFCGTWYLPHSHIHNERTVPIIMAGCIAHARNGRISTSCEKFDVTIVFLDPIS